MTDRAPLPYDFMPEVPSFTVESNDVAEGEQMSNAQVFNSFGMSGRQHLTAACAGHGFPARDQELRRHRYDPDAPTGSGFWHWLVLDIPASVTELATGAGAAGGPGLPKGAFSVRNDYGTKDFGGAAPPAGDPPHRYVFAVHALDTESSASTPTSPPPWPASTCVSTPSPAGCSSRSSATDGQSLMQGRH